MLTTRITLTVVTLISSALSFLGYTLLLKYLGASKAVDQLFFAGSIPLSVAGVITGVLLYLLPARLVDLQNYVQEATVRTLSIGVFATWGLLALMACVLAFYTDGKEFWLLFLVFLSVACLLIITTLATCLAQVRGKYFATTVAPLATSCGLFIGVAAAITFSLEWLLAIGQLVGAAIGLVCLAYVLRISFNASVRVDLRVCAHALAPLLPHIITLTLGTLAFTLFQPIDAALCTQLGGGSLSILAYAQRVLVAVSTLVSMGAHVIAARTSHDTLRSGGELALRELANAEVTKIVVFGVLIWAAFNLGGSQLLALLFSGSTMTDLDRERLTDCLRWMLLGGGPMAAMPYLFRIFYAMQSYKRPAILGVTTITMYAALSWIMLPIFDVKAMAYSYAIVWWTTLIVAIMWLNSGITISPQKH